MGLATRRAHETAEGDPLLDCTPACRTVARFPVVIWTIVAHNTDHKLVVVSLAPEVRRPLWVTLIGTWGTVAGLMLASVSILISLIKTPMSNLDRPFGDMQKRSVGDTILGGMPTLAALFVLSIVASVTDGHTKQGSWPLEVLVVLALAASVSPSRGSSGLSRSGWRWA